MGEKPLRSRGEYGIRQALRFRANHALAEVGCTVAACHPERGLDAHPTLLPIPPQACVSDTHERARTEVKHHSEHDAEAVTFFVGQSQQDANYRRRKREQIFWRLSSCR